jgi:nucleotide-binding universal stress UspA family protein
VRNNPHQTRPGLKTDPAALRCVEGIPGTGDALTAIERRDALEETAMTEAITRILVPIDFSAHSDRALRYATTLADRLNATVEVLHVVEDPFVSGAWSPEAVAPNIPELLADLVAAARGKLEDLKAAALDKGVRLKTTVLTTVVSGRPADSITDYARTERFDLIVMGTHGRTGLSHALLGSVAERVVRTAPCPVLTVRDATLPAPEKEPAATVTII